MTDAAFQFADKIASACPSSRTASIHADRVGRDDFGFGETGSDTISADEISELVSGALQDAMLAAAKPCPATYLDVLKGRKRDRIIARMNGLPSVQLSHPVVQAEVLKEFAMMRAQSKLANGIVDGLRDYACSKRRAVMCAMT